MKEIICSNCFGKGIIEKYKHVEEGICFKCSGKGKISVEDCVEDIVKIIKENSKQSSKNEEEFKELYNKLKDTLNDYWKAILDNAQGTETLTKWEHKTSVLNSYLAFKNEFKEYISKNPNLIDKDLDEIEEIKEKIMLKYIK
jgi:RecJ-like exonuclease